MHVYIFCLSNQFIISIQIVRIFHFFANLHCHHQTLLRYCPQDDFQFMLFPFPHSLLGAHQDLHYIKHSFFPIYYCQFIQLSTQLGRVLIPFNKHSYLHPGIICPLDHFQYICPANSNPLTNHIMFYSLLFPCRRCYRKS